MAGCQQTPSDNLTEAPAVANAGVVAKKAAPAPEAAPKTPVVKPAAGRVVAVGDLHGDLENSKKVLQLAGLINDAEQWTGGETILVQTGDTTDRGPSSRGVMKLIRELQPKAKAAGGEVIALVGNHEWMNLKGDWRYVSKEDLSEYGGEESRRRAFSAEGEDGKWLSTLGVSAMVGDVVFVHGGIHPSFSAGGVRGINAAAKQRMATDKDAAILGELGPMWYRGYVLEEESVACPLLEKALKKLGASRMVVGHTVRRDGVIQERCGGRLSVIDVGIGKGYGGHIAYWESTGGDAKAVYPGREVDLLDPKR